jgi:hypothetical protein
MPKRLKPKKEKLYIVSCTREVPEDLARGTGPFQIAHQSNCGSDRDWAITRAEMLRKRSGVKDVKMDEYDYVGTLYFKDAE